MKTGKKLTNSEIAAFCRQSAMMIKAGITLAEGMDIMMQDTINSEGKALLADIGASCKKGEHFSDALKATKMFPEYVVTLTALGEESGNLDTVLASLALFYEKEETLSENIKSAVTYPLIMIIMMFIVILVLIMKVLPIFKQVFAQLGTQMSPLAVSLLSAGNTLNQYSIVFIVIFSFIVIVGLILTKTQSGKNHFRNFLAVFPFTKTFYTKLAAGRFASGMYLAISSGMDTFQSLDMISDIVENKVMREKITICKDELSHNTNFPEALSKAGIFSRLNLRMIVVGFRSGSIDSVMKQISQNYEIDTDRQLNKMISVIEPTLVIILSLIVGIILLSVILPLMGIMSSIG